MRALFSIAFRMRNFLSASILTTTLLAGCFTTQLHTGQQQSFAPVKNDRQWFTLGGLVQLSGAAGQECKNGVSWAESGQKTTDILISIGLTVAGAVAAGAACKLPDNATDEEKATNSLCQAGIGGVLPLLIASRSVEYQCVNPANPPGIQVPTLSPAPGSSR
jgi:hypothetical protein